jgi:hypothetical protein
MKIALKARFVISFIFLLQIISYSSAAQSKKEQISILNYQLDSLKHNVQIGQTKIREFEAQLISVNKNLNDLLGELMITKKLLAKEDSLKTFFTSELKNVTKKLLLSEEKSIQMNSIINSSKVEIDELKKELTKRDSLIGIYEKQSLIDKDSILLLNLAKPNIDNTKTNKKDIDLTARLNPKTKYWWTDLIPGTYVDKNCNSNRIYEWSCNSEMIRNGGSMAYAQMWLRVLIDNAYIDVLSSAQDNYEIIEGGLLYDGSKKIIILSATSFMTDDGCIWIRKLNAPKSETNYLYVIGKPIKIGNLEVAQYDFPEAMSNDDAKLACARLGKGWRLPTKKELNSLYQNRYKIGGFANNHYWSSTEDGNYHAWTHSFFFDGQPSLFKTNEFSVRAVRTF